MTSLFSEITKSFNMKKLLGILVVCLFLISCNEEEDCCVLPPSTNYSFETATAQGCSDFYVYKELSEQKLHLYVSGKRSDLGLNLTEQTFDVNAPSLTIQMHLFNDEIGSYACDDVANDQGEIGSTWTAISGAVTIQITEDSISVDPWGTTFKMTVKLKDMVLENEKKEVANLPEELFEDVFVGWLPG